MSTLPRNDSGAQDVPAAAVAGLDDDRYVFNLSALLTDDLLPDEVPQQVGASSAAVINVDRFID